MIKTIITMVVTAIAGLIGYLVSDSFRERLAQRQRDRGIRLIKPTSKTKPQLRLAGRFNSQRALQQPSRFELGFAQAEVMAELVDIGDAHLFIEDRQGFGNELRANYALVHGAKDYM